MPPIPSVVSPAGDVAPALPIEAGYGNPIWLAYLAVFLLAGAACFAVIPRLDRIEDDDTRRGLTWLLLTSGGWALAIAGVVIVDDPGIEYGFHMVGLVIGMSTVGPWLYFCSAFTGRSLHRNRGVQAIAVGVFLLITLVKVTNPLHGVYFTVAEVGSPFPHLAFQPEILHWIAMGLAYALAAVGYFMLFELFAKTDIDARPFVILVAITGLPIILDVVSLHSDALLSLNYEPLGVAVFAVGVFALYVERLQTIQLASGRSEPAIVLDDDGRVRDSNADAKALFPGLGDGIGQPLEAVVPAVARKLEGEDDLISMETDGDTRFYRVSENPFSTDHAALGRLLVLDDVTHRERYRRELERQNDRLEQFAGMVSHDLRNPLNVAQLRLERATADGRDDEDLEAAGDALERMETLIDDVLTLARQGQPIDDPEPVSLSAAGRNAWAMVESDGATFVVAEEMELEADPERLQQLLENLFRNALEHGSDGATVTVGPLEDGDGFFVADDGPGIPAEQREEIFESGYTTNAGGTGFGLAIVDEIADAHRWAVSVTESDDGGARFEFRDVQTV